MFRVGKTHTKIKKEAVYMHVIIRTASNKLHGEEMKGFSLNSLMAHW